MVKTVKYLSNIEMYFLIAGHTKFSPDAHFGKIKNYMRNKNIESILDLINEQGIIN